MGSSSDNPSAIKSSDAVSKSTFSQKWSLRYFARSSGSVTSSGMVIIGNFSCAAADITVAAARHSMIRNFFIGILFYNYSIISIIIP